MTTKEETKEEIQKVDSDILALKEELEALKESYDDFEANTATFQTDTNSGMSEIKRNNKFFEDQINLLKKMIARISNGMTNAAALGGGIPDNVGKGGGASPHIEAIVKQMQVDLSNHMKNTDVTFMQVNHELNGRPKQGALDDLESSLLIKLNEILAQLDMRYADKESTRKRFNNLEKNVSINCL